MELLTPSTTFTWVRRQQFTPDPYAQETMTCCQQPQDTLAFCICYHYMGHPTGRFASINEDGENTSELGVWTTYVYSVKTHKYEQGCSWGLKCPHSVKAHRAGGPVCAPSEP